MEVAACGDRRRPIYFHAQKSTQFVFEKKKKRRKEENSLLDACVCKMFTIHDHPANEQRKDSKKEKRVYRRDELKD